MGEEEEDDDSPTPPISDDDEQQQVDAQRIDMKLIENSTNDIHTVSNDNHVNTTYKKSNVAIAYQEPAIPHVNGNFNEYNYQNHNGNRWAPKQANNNEKNNY